MRNFFLGILATLVFLALAAYSYIAMGYMPVATSAKPLPFEEFLAHTALHAVMKGQRNKTSPVPANESSLIAGAKIYTTNCAVCHGVPHEEKTPIAKGMFPAPPELFEADDRVTDDPVGTIFWKVKNGIRLTGMPGFGDTLSEDQMWQVSLTLKYADHLPASALHELKIPKVNP